VKHAPRKRTVCEHVRRDHLAAVRDRSSLEMRVEPQCVQPVLRAHAVHLAQDGSCVSRRASVRSNGARKQYESSKK
jgi:hypothetical protein